MFSDSEVGSKDLMWIDFADVNKTAAISFNVYLAPKPIYHLETCMRDTNIPLDKLGKDKNRVWTLEKESSRVRLSCNSIEIFDFDTQTSAGYDDNCRALWAPKFAVVIFKDDIGGNGRRAIDTASDLYRKLPKGKI